MKSVKLNDMTVVGVASVKMENAENPGTFVEFSEKVQGGVELSAAYANGVLTISAEVTPGFIEAGDVEEIELTDEQLEALGVPIGEDPGTGGGGEDDPGTGGGEDDPGTGGGEDDPGTGIEDGPVTLTWVNGSGTEDTGNEALAVNGADTYDEIIESLASRSNWKVTQLLPIVEDKVYSISASAVGYGAHFGLAFFDGDETYLDETNWEGSGNLGYLDIGETKLYTYTANTGKLTDDTGNSGAFLKEGEAAFLVIFMRSRGNMTNNHERATATLTVRSAN